MIEPDLTNEMSRLFIFRMPEKIFEGNTEQTLRRERNSCAKKKYVRHVSINNKLNMRRNDMTIRFIETLEDLEVFVQGLEWIIGLVAKEKHTKVSYYGLNHLPETLKEFIDNLKMAGNDKTFRFPAARGLASEAPPPYSSLQV